MIREERLMQLVASGARVRAKRGSAEIEGRLIAVCFEPMLIIEDDNGGRHHFASTMPGLEVAEWQALA